MASGYVVQPPARRMRIAALVLSFVSVAFAIAFGFAVRRAIVEVRASGSLDDTSYLPIVIQALVLLLVAMLLRMAAAICELFWLERAWSNLPAELRVVGPINNVSSGMAVGLSFVPGLAWFWKLGLVIGIADGFEKMRAVYPFQTPIPRRLGMAAVIVSWVPGLNVYVAPFLWEVFATRLDKVMNELVGAVSLRPPSPPTRAP